MNRLIDDFLTRLTSGTVAVVYFSGHGVQVGGGNYLLPVDLKPEREADLTDDGIDLGRLMARMSAGNDKFNLAIIDACRDNPFEIAGRTLGGRKGLAPTTASGAMIVYAAGANQSAIDRLGPSDSDPNGVFTREFLKVIREPGLPIREAIAKVKIAVARLAETVGARQTPAVYDEATGDFVFTPAATVANTPALAPPASDGATVEVAFWQSIQNSGRAADFEEYLRQFPSGRFAGLARIRLDELRRSQTAAIAPPATAVQGPTVEPVDRPMVANINANVREQPSVQARIVARLSAGQSVQVLGKIKGENWYLVDQPGKPPAYVAANLLEDEAVWKKRSEAVPPPPPASAKIGTTFAGPLEQPESPTYVAVRGNVLARTGPGAKEASRFALSENETVTALGRHDGDGSSTQESLLGDDGGWIKVATRGGNEGFVEARDLLTPAQMQERREWIGKREQLAAFFARAERSYGRFAAIAGVYCPGTCPNVVPGVHKINLGLSVLGRYLIWGEGETLYYISAINPTDVHSLSLSFDREVSFNSGEPFRSAGKIQIHRVVWTSGKEEFIGFKGNNLFYRKEGTSYGYYTRSGTLATERLRLLDDYYPSIIEDFPRLKKTP
jgi:uncharacterized protein YgiM (DUF1202 family)